MSPLNQHTTVSVVAHGTGQHARLRIFGVTRRRIVQGQSRIPNNGTIGRIDTQHFSQHAKNNDGRKRIGLIGAANRRRAEVAHSANDPGQVDLTFDNAINCFGNVSMFVIARARIIRSEPHGTIFFFFFFFFFVSSKQNSPDRHNTFISSYCVQTATHRFVDILELIQRR
jgi:hypothetical protein